MNRKRNLLNMQTIMMAVMLCFGFVSCGDDDEIVNPNNGQTINPSTPVNDPEGTIVVNMNNGQKDNWIDIGIGSSIHIDEANNFVGNSSSVEFASVGVVQNLGNVNTIPSAGWSKSSAVVPGTGYVVRYGSNYARMYVVEYTVNTSGGIMGATVKYHSPFQLPISLESTSLTFTSGASSQSVKLLNPTRVSVEDKPIWCSVSIGTNSITVSVAENLSAQQYSGDIVLKNSVNSVKLRVTQIGSTSPKFDGGRGTIEDPYQIKTPQQLDNVRLALNSHFVQKADINLESYLDANGSGWNPIGTYEKAFTGDFNGNLHTIRGIWARRSTTNNIGLFGYMKNAYVHGVRLEIAEIGLSGRNTGGICGYATDSKISECSMSGKIQGRSMSGGILSSADNAIIEKCYSKGVIVTSDGKPDGTSGGICGSSESCAISNCYSEAEITGTSNWYAAMGIGGGSNTNCYFVGNLNSEGVGGVFPLTYYGFIEHSYYLSGLPNGYGYGQALSSSEMMKQSSFEGWDFINIWKITEGQTYPTLRCFDR